MNRTLAAILLLMIPALGWAAGADVELDHADIDLTNEASLQRGAKLFVNYCMGCHSADAMRYSRLSEDLSLTEDQIKGNLMLPTGEYGRTMSIAMPEEASEDWFGTSPPDLSVIARVRGADWLYTYLRSFYVDESKRFGVNNLLFPNVAMPHALWQLQGWQEPVYDGDGHGEGEGGGHIDHLELVEEGTMTPPEYDRAVRDLTAYLVYMGEPVKVERQRLGVWVLLFLALLFVVAYSLKREYWKDVH